MILLALSAKYNTENNKKGNRDDLRDPCGV